MTDTIPTIDETQLNSLGTTLFRAYTMYQNDRKPAEERWLQNLRQYRGIYDPEVLAMIGKDQSKAYPKLTRKVVIGTVARLMQMLFPNTERNYGVRASPIPDLSTEQLQEVLDALVTAKAQGGDPAQVELTDDEIEKAIKQYAMGKAEKMELKVDDDLQEMEYVTLARKVVFSSTLYNVGVLAGPYNIKFKARKWQKNVNTGKYEAIEIDKYKPRYEFRRVWDHYPDMTAKALDSQDGAFDRHIMTRAQVEELIERHDFMGVRVCEWLNKHLEGNYAPLWWEAVLTAEPKGDRSLVTQRETRKYELAEWRGGVKGSDLRGAGITVADEDVGKTFYSNVWTIGNWVIKAKLSPFDSTVKHHHYFVFEDDDLSLLGNGQGDTMRDSQLSLGEVTRAALDNSSVVGPMVVVNDDHISPGQNMAIRKHMTIHIEDMASTAQISNAVANLTIDSHISELLALRQALLDFSSEESGLPPPSLGDVSQGGSEALRTQGGASMFLGAAALPIRDTVRNYDSFTMSVINSLVKWNQKFDSDPARDGDHNVIARGSTSLIAKEVLAQSLDAVRQTVTPDEAPHIKSRKLLEMRLKARDVPIDEIMEDEDKADAIIKRNADLQMQTQQQQMALIEAQVHEALGKAVAMIAKAHKDDASIELDAGKLLVEALNKGHENAIKETVANKPEPRKAKGT